jgi:ankyrin repeat protein
MTVEKSVAPQEPMASRPAASSSPQPLQTEQKTQPTALRDTRKKPPVTVAVFTLQTLAATPPQQLAPRSRPLSDDEQTLFQAVIAGDNQKVAHLLDAGVSPNVKSSGGWTPLMWAVIDGRLALIQTLLDKDAAVNVKNNRGMTPLMYAAWNGRTDILQLFLDKGANVHARDIHGATALHYARDPIAKFTRREERPRLERILAQAAAQKPRTKR